MEYSCYLRSVQDLLADSLTPCERRFSTEYPCGTEVNIYPISSKDHGREDQFGIKVIPGFSWDTPRTRGEVGLMII